MLKAVFLCEGEVSNEILFSFFLFLTENSTRICLSARYTYKMIASGDPHAAHLFLFRIINDEFSDMGR